jgi:hypothetical protein
VTLAEQNISAVADTDLWSLFTRRDTGWAGADTAYSVPLPDGRLAWLFGDTMLGPVNADRSRPRTIGFIHNSIVVQDGTRLSTLHGGSRDEPRSLFTPTDGSSWYWLGDGTVEGDRLHVFLLKFLRSGAGQWDWHWTGNELATLRLPELTVESISPVPSTAGIQYGAAILEERSYTYVYGVEDRHYAKYAHVARAKRGEIRGPWEFFTGRDWSPVPTRSQRILNDSIANEFGVTKIDGGYLLVTMDTAKSLTEWGEIVGYVAKHPAGPWGDRRLLYTAPEPDRERIFVYNAHVHPELSRKGALLISYNVNSLRFDDLYTDADLYRPRFVRVPVPEFNP